MTPVLHVAGVFVTINQRVRQRCAWCGAVLIDVDAATIAVPVGQPYDGVPTWPVGDLVGVDGDMSYAVPHSDGDPLPDGACGKLDPEVTR